MKLKSVFLLAGAFLLIAGCAGKKKDIPPEVRCAELYKKAYKAHTNKEWMKSQELWDQFLTSCAGNDSICSANFFLAQSYYNQKQWADAEYNFGNLVRDYPGCKFKCEAMLDEGLAIMKQTLSWDQDQEETTNAKKKFSQVLDDCQDEKIRAQAEKHIAELNDMLAKRVYKTGELYFRMDQPKAAIIYWENLISEYPASEYIPSAYYNMARAYIDLNDKENSCKSLTKALETGKNDKSLLKKISKLSFKTGCKL